MKENYFLAKWLHNEISEESLKEHLSEDEIRSYKKIIAATGHLATPQYNAEKELEKIKAIRHESNKKKKRFTSRFYRAAAVISLLIASYYFISNQNTQFSTGFAEKISFELPDKSNVNLNAGSEISYSSGNWKENRTLSLKGEAYFSVFKGSEFTVNTSIGTVSVLGTKFNVVVRDQYFEVNCYEGLVSTNYRGKPYKIPAGSSFKVLNSTINFKDNLAETNPDWLQNNSTFNSMPYGYVIKEFERQYNITVSYNTKYANTLFTGSFTHTNLKIALQAVSIPLNFNYKIINAREVSLQQE